MERLTNDKHGKFIFAGEIVMCDTVTVEMPRYITADLINAVRFDETTTCEDKDEMNKCIGWLICAYDVMVAKQLEGGK